MKKNEVQIVSWLLTRRCNLKCSYCRISRGYKDKPSEYPSLKRLYEEEMDLMYILETLRRFKSHNPDAFHIFYGGEPLLREDLPDIITFCNMHNIQYTIITNNTPAVQSELDRLLYRTTFDVRGIIARL